MMRSKALDMGLFAGMADKPLPATSQANAPLPREGIKRVLKAGILLMLLLCGCACFAQISDISKYNVTWTTQSKNASESMPCGGGDIGLNVWVENGDILIYLGKSGAFDENNTLLKLGRIRVKLMPNPFVGQSFKQELVLNDGNIVISGANNTKVDVWVDVFGGIAHIDVSSDKALSATAAYESWRYRDRVMKGRETNQSSWKFGAPPNTVTYADSISFVNNTVQFYHKNRDSSVFDATVKQQGMQAVKGEMFNPLFGLKSGGFLRGENMVSANVTTGTYNNTDYKAWQLQSKNAAKQHQIEVNLYTTRPFKNEKLSVRVRKPNPLYFESAKLASIEWWHQYWQRSFIDIAPDKRDAANEQWQVGRNYQLFRYMLGCNAMGTSPTKFNGGLFTVDPSYTDTLYHFTPDFRNWGGGLATAQNQRLVYLPMLKSGDWDMLRPQFDFYLKTLHNAELRSKVYWGHAGASFTEQIENFGLPNYAEYGTKRPANYDKGMEYNAWLEYEWDTVFQFCLMMLDEQQYSGKDIKAYIPFIESCLTFYSEHYQYLAKQRGSKALDGKDHLVLYPGSAAETYKMATNSTTTIAALQTILTRLLALPDTYLTADSRKQWTVMLSQIPPIALTQTYGKTTIAPAQLWERINNTESPQLYPVYPWHIYGVGKPELQTAINTYLYDADALKFRSHVGWKQDNIFAADLGLTDEAARLNTLKLKDSGRRFPAFWGPGFDWVPDHNWGGSGMIGLQEMLLQCDGKAIYLFAAWPKAWDVHFKLHAPFNTTVEAVLKDGVVKQLTVLPVERMKDVVVMLR